MGRVIADTYEIAQEIGSGGSGIVYLARHLRLGKWVVLKADKRSITTKPESLRREVDSLKDLSHTYIPKVYDFIVEQDTVYTVMDFIEGESLDKPLKRGERFPQPQVITWACQLLEAVCYLHSRPPHGILHSDIKPANIMVTPDNEIRLIDFNIALALGEEGAVRVGFSSGYASPEHYGIDYTAANMTQGDSAVQTQISADMVVTNMDGSGLGSSSLTRKRGILLDVRSDIYSLGATLYHLLTGTRPPQDAAQVKPISSPNISPAVATIVMKAMAPAPSQRYQTAQDMLDAFRHLRENDPRTKRLKRWTKAAAAVLSVILLIGAICTFSGLRQMEQTQAQAAEEARLAEEAARVAEVAERTAQRALAAVSAAEEAYRNGDMPRAAARAREALLLDSPYTAQAQSALAAALGVYDLSDGFKPHLLLELPSEPLKTALSPAGTRLGAIVSGQMLVFDTESGRQLASLPADGSALSDIAFPSEDMVLYAGEDALRVYDLTANKELWHGGEATAIALSADGSTVAAVYKEEGSATVYDVQSGLVRRTVSFQGQALHTDFNDRVLDEEADLFALNANGTLLAVGFSDSGALWVYDLRSSEDDIQIFDQSDFRSFQGGFCGPYFAFTAQETEQSVFGVIDTEQLVQTGGFVLPGQMSVQADESGIYVCAGRLVSQIDPVSFEEKERAYSEDAYITAFDVSGNYTVAALEGGGFAVFDISGDCTGAWRDGAVRSAVCIAGDFAAVSSTDSPKLQVLRLERHPEAQVLAYDADYDHSEARISADGSTVMLFRYTGFRIYDLDGEVVAEAELPIPEGDQVYDQQYRRDEAGSRLEVTYYSGTVRAYSASDGALLWEKSEEAPDETLFEEFLTEHLRVERPLHGTPVAYDRETGQMLRELEADDYLTYVTETGEYIITEYISSQTRERYGLLLNQDLETLARLPALCDVLEDGTLIFDDQKGNLRQCRIYSPQELLALAE